jgi:hypothetical protein
LCVSRLRLPNTSTVESGRATLRALKGEMVRVEVVCVSRVYPVCLKAKSKELITLCERKKIDET